MRSVFAGLGFIALLASCGTKVTFTPTNEPPQQMAPKAAAAVEVFMGQQPGQPYLEVGYFEAQQQSVYSSGSSKKILDKLRERAGKMGCDGIIVLGTADRVVGDNTGTATLKGYRASCFVYTADAAPPASSTEVTAATAAPPAPPAQAQACVPGSTQRCVGPGACQGAQACASDGSAWGQCDCGSAAPGESSAPSADDADAEDTRP